MKISQKGIDMIKEFEGLSLDAYRCAAGVWTIGYGHTAGVEASMRISLLEAENLLRQDLDKFEKHVAKFTMYDFNQNQFDALVSFAFNVGNINQLTNAGKRTIAQIEKHWCAYNKVGGQVMPGLVRRREKELALFCTSVDGLVERSVLIVDGVEYEIERILYDGVNFIKIRDVAKVLGYAVSNQGSVAVLSHKN